MEQETADRRRIQRIATSQEGQPQFWLLHDGGRRALRDLSLEGFAFAHQGDVRPGTRLSFSIEWDAELGEVVGEAEVVNLSPDQGQVGCRIVSIAADSRELLRGWLAGHVLACAAVPLSHGEAEEIVSGPSIV